MTDIESVVIGAGVIGLATAAALARQGHEVIVLEREQSIGQSVSARNSEVIHAGIYYPPGSLKAKLCVRGRKMLYQYCAERGIPHERIGKLIVAGDESEAPALRKLHERAIQNAVKNIAMLSASDATALQPGLHCSSALYSPDTGIVDSHALMQNLDADIANHGGVVVCQSNVAAIEYKNPGFVLTLADGASISTKNVINSCGLDAVAMAETCNAVTSTPGGKASVPEARFAKGNYFRLAAKAPFTKLIYPAPVVGGLGIHLTIDLAGLKRFGPDVEWLDHEQLNAEDRKTELLFDYSVDPSRCESFYAAIRRYWPDLPDHSLVPDYAGVRPKIHRPGTDNIDFEISTQQHHGISGLVNLFGFESPGLTSSLAIAEKVAQAL